MEKTNTKKLYYREYTRDASGKQKNKWVPTGFLIDVKNNKVIADRKVCPRWANLPGGDCSECPDANENCVFVTGVC